MTTLNLILSIKVLYDLFRLVYPSINYQVLSLSSRSPSAVFREYGPGDLFEFNGTQPDKPILIAIGGLVFDVSKGATFYGPDGPYGNFAGRDASRGMAMHSFDEQVLTPIDQPRDKLDDLTVEQISALNEWIDHFKRKYTVVGSFK